MFQRHEMDSSRRKFHLWGTDWKHRTAVLMFLSYYGTKMLWKRKLCLYCIIFSAYAFVHKNIITRMDTKRLDVSRNGTNKSSIYIVIIFFSLSQYFQICGECLCEISKDLYLDLTSFCNTKLTHTQKSNSWEDLKLKFRCRLVEWLDVIVIKVCAFQNIVNVYSEFCTLACLEITRSVWYLFISSIKFQVKSKVA